MADGTKIEWTDATWNVITGCTVKSPGCIHCYAMKLAGTRLKNHPSREGLTILTKNGPVWNGRVRFNQQWLMQPLEWRKPRNIFPCAHGDLFHEEVIDDWLDPIWGVMTLADQHFFQVLTKRPELMLRYLGDKQTPDAISEQCDKLAPAHWCRRELDDFGGLPLRNVILGVSVENQEWADKRREPMRRLAELGWRVWVSYEPSIGPVNWAGWEFISWMVSGGESGPNARPSHPDWHRRTRDWCARYGVAFHFKQWGEWAPHTPFAGGDLGGDVRAGRVRIVHPNGRSDVEIAEMTGGRNTIPRSRYMAAVGKKSAGRLLDGVEHNGYPIQMALPPTSTGGAPMK